MSEGYYQHACRTVQAIENQKLYEQQDIDLAAKAAEAAGAEVEFVDVAQPDSTCVGALCRPLPPPVFSATDDGQSEAETGDNTSEAL